MKLAIDLPKPLLEKAFKVAARGRTTVDDLVVQGLKSVTEENEAEAEAVEALIAALSTGRNIAPIGPLRREQLQDGEVLLRY